MSYTIISNAFMKMRQKMEISNFRNGKKIFEIQKSESKIGENIYRNHKNKCRLDILPRSV